MARDKQRERERECGDTVNDIEETGSARETQNKKSREGSQVLTKIWFNVNDRRSR